MDNYKYFSDIIIADDPYFNEIWDENTSNSEEETKEEARIVASDSDLEVYADSQQGRLSERPIPAKSTHILKRLAKPNSNHRREKLTISFITAENQSVVSTISKSTFHSNSSTIDMASVLVDSPLDREVSEISTAMRIKPTRPQKDESQKSGIFLNLYESIISEQGLSMSRCVKKDNIVEDEADITLRFIETSHTDETVIERFKQDKAPSDPIDDTSISQNPAKSTRKPCSMNTFFADSEPIMILPDLFASTATQFVSSSLTVDDMSQVSILEGENNNDTNKASASLEKEGANGTTMTPNLPAVTLEEKRLDERSLLDTLSPEEPQEKPVTSVEESQNENKKEELVEEENVTEGLGLLLPPSLPTTPQTAQTKEPQDDSQETLPEKIQGESQEMDPPKTQVNNQETLTGMIDSDSQEAPPKKIQGESREIIPRKTQVDPQEKQPGKIEGVSQEIIPPKTQVDPQENQPGKTEGDSQETLWKKIEGEYQEMNPPKTHINPQETQSGKIEGDCQEILPNKIQVESQETNPRKIPVDTQETQPGTIEVDETGQILIDDEVDSVENSSNHDHLRNYQELRSSPWDVYISYRIEPNQFDDNLSLSNSSVRTPPKQGSGSKFRLISRFKMKKVFSGNRGRKNVEKMIPKKAFKSIYDSPGRTVATATTVTTASTTTTTPYANMAFAAEYPVSRKSLPSFLRLRPKTKV